MPSAAADLSPRRREGLEYGLVDPEGRFHVLRASSFPPVFECGLRAVGELVDFYPMGNCCANCVRVVEARCTTVTGQCRLGHRQHSYECPGCAEALGHGEQSVEHWRWFRGRTSSKRIKAAIDSYLKARAKR